MDNKVLDEAVEVARLAYGSTIPDEERMRAALLAGVKVLLGEPVAWQEVKDDGEPEWHDASFAETATPFDRSRPLYAPSLGEGG